MDFRSSTPTGISIEVCTDEIMEKQNIDMIDNEFKNNYADDDGDIAYGGAMYLLCNQLNVDETLFDSNYASYEKGGGVAYFADVNTNIKQSRFYSMNHKIKNSGGLFHINNYDESNADFTLKDSRVKYFDPDGTRRRLQSGQDMIDNTASLITIDSAPSLIFDNITFTDNGLPLIYGQTFLCPNVEFTDCIFTDNTGWTIIDMDHATTLQDESYTIIDNCEFENNTVTFGLIRLEASVAQIDDTIIKGNENTLLISTFVLVTDGTITNTDFIGNDGKYDGILSIGQYAIANIYNATFIDNTVGGNGGAIQSKADELYVFGSTFEDNSAGLNGGHIAQFEGKLIIDESDFNGGSAGGNGGAVWMSRNNVRSGMIAIITNTVFDGNSAGFHGGAILIDTPTSNKPNSLTLENVDFVNNYAGHSGGAIYVRSKYDITLNIDYDTVSFIDNEAGTINRSLDSWPDKYTVTSNQTEICPGCNVTIIMNTDNIFGDQWIPHNFSEYIFTSGQEIGNITDDSIISDFAKAVNITFEILQGMHPESGITVATAQIEAIYQSPTFINGVGTEIFTYGPAILSDRLTLRLAGYAADGFAIVDEVNITFSVVLCDAHMGATTYNGGRDVDIPGLGHAFRCTICERNTYRFIPTSTDECHQCPPRAVCEGGSGVFVENDHYPLITDERGLEVLECAPGTCCLLALCRWDEVDGLCPEGRNVESPMCSECIDKYSVSPLSTQCIECVGINYWYFIIPALGYALLIWWWGHSSPFDLSLAAWEVYTEKILSFYYQVLPSINLLIPDQSETTDISATIEGIFNFDPQIEGICAYENLTNLQQLALQLVTPMICLLWINIQ